LILKVNIGIFQNGTVLVLAHSDGRDSCFSLSFSFHPTQCPGPHLPSGGGFFNLDLGRKFHDFRKQSKIFYSIIHKKNRCQVSGFWCQEKETENLKSDTWYPKDTRFPDIWCLVFGISESPTFGRRALLAIGNNRYENENLFCSRLNFSRVQLLWFTGARLR
jgi:hypothetical protein